jgi:hypothetical protein
MQRYYMLNNYCIFVWKKSNRPHLEHGPHLAHDTNKNLQKYDKNYKKIVNHVFNKLFVKL